MIEKENGIPGVNSGCTEKFSKTKTPAGCKNENIQHSS
jgi:hypothetical protein